MLLTSGFLVACASFALAGRTDSFQLPLTSTNGLTLQDVIGSPATYKGRKAVRLVEKDMSNMAKSTIAKVDGIDFGDGTIDVDVAGLVAHGADEGARGFAGIVFRSDLAGDKGEVFYIRPTNGRCDDQLRRNHATQYVSSPDYPWERLRKENPGVYESYADMDAGLWTHLRIEVKGDHAKFFVGKTEQPCLVVNDLKLGSTAHGAVGLWIGPGTEAYFANLKISKQ